VSWRTVLLGLLAFVVALIVALPARWVGGMLPTAVRCGEWRGTAWNGRCRQLTVAVPDKPAFTIETAGWKVHPLPLLRATVSAEVVMTDSRGDVAGHVDLSRDGSIAVRNMSARVLFDPQLPIAMPAGWRGRIEVERFELDLQHNELRHLQGQFNFFDLRDEDGRELGDYHVVFPPATTPPFTGQLSDAGGPLELRGTLRLSADRQWEVSGTVAARAGADTALADDLAILGAPDGKGRYPLSATGSFR
jgi:general secretion pathway protein N